MSRSNAIARAHASFDDGRFLTALSRRVAIPSTSQESARAGALRAYLDDEIAPALTPLGFTCRVLDNPHGPPALVAEQDQDEEHTAGESRHGEEVHRHQRGDMIGEKSPPCL